jgi:hypothetical protein
MVAAARASLKKRWMTSSRADSALWIPSPPPCGDARVLGGIDHAHAAAAELAQDAIRPSWRSITARTIARPVRESRRAAGGARASGGARRLR